MDAVEEAAPPVDAARQPSASGSRSSEEEESKAASSPLLVTKDSAAADGAKGSALAASPKHQRHGANGHADAVRGAGGREEEALEAEEWQEEADQGAEARSRRRRRPRGPDWFGEMMDEAGKLSYAPYDLFIVYSMKVAECTGYYAMSYVYAHYLTEEFGMSDQEAGNMYAIYGLLCSVVGIILGVSIDRLGIRKALILGTLCSLFARILTTVTTSSFWITFACLVPAPVGAAFGVPAMALGVRRYSHEENRSFAFSFFYAALCLACVLSSILINRVRDAYIDGVYIAGFEWTWMRVVMVWSTVCTAYTVVASFFVRDIQVSSEHPIEEEVYETRRTRPRTNLKEIFKQRRFWRVCGVTLIFCGVRMTFRHMDATFPKYFIRTHGRDAPFEIIVGFEPLLTMLVTPVVTLFIQKLQMRLDQTLLIGAFISGISVFALAVEETYNSAIAFVVILAVGESIWSPKLYEYSTMAAPEGREGIFVAISFAPVYLASVPVGYLSGWALSVFCPRNSTPEDKRGKTMWFIIGLVSFSSFLLLACCRRRLFGDSGGLEEEGQDGEDSL